MFFWIIGLLVLAGEFIVGFGLIYGCLTGMASREGMYDSESTNYMLLSQWIGVGIGVLLLANAFGFINIPLLPGLNLGGTGGG